MARAKGYYSKVARHAPKMESCGKCQAQAARILEARPARPRKPRAPRVKKARNTRITFDADGNPMPPPPRKRRGPNRFTTSRHFVGPMAFFFFLKEFILSYGGNVHKKQKDNLGKYTKFQAI